MIPCATRTPEIQKFCRGFRERSEATKTEQNFRISDLHILKVVAAYSILVTVVSKISFDEPSYTCPTIWTSAKLNGTITTR